MQEAKLNTAPGNPVIAAQINLEQNFAFIEVHCYGLVSILCICCLLAFVYFIWLGPQINVSVVWNWSRHQPKVITKEKLQRKRLPLLPIFHQILATYTCIVAIFLSILSLLLLVEVVLIRSCYVLNVECTCMVCVFNLKHTIYSAVFTHLLFSQTYQLRSVEETTQAMAFDGIILEVQFRKCCSLVLANLMSMNTSGKNLTTVTINLMVTLREDKNHSISSNKCPSLRP